MPQKFPDAGSTTNRISLTDPHVVESWCSELKCTEYELRVAVYAVGSAPDEIRSYFHRSRDTCQQ